MFTYLAYLAIQNAVRQRERPDEPVDPLFARLIEPPVTTMTSLAMHEMYDAETFRRMVEAHRK